MRALLLPLLLLAALVPLASPASGCQVNPYPSCDVSAGPVSAGGWVDTQWWPIEAEFYHCAFLVENPHVTGLWGCQYYRMA